MIDRINLLDAYGVPDNLTEADAEYVRIKLTRTRSSGEAEQCREQLRIIEEQLEIEHKKLVKQINGKRK